MIKLNLIVLKQNYCFERSVWSLPINIYLSTCFPAVDGQLAQEMFNYQKLQNCIQGFNKSTTLIFSGL